MDILQTREQLIEAFDATYVAELLTGDSSITECTLYIALSKAVNAARN